MNKVLSDLKNEINQKASFKTFIFLIMDEKEVQFEGIINGVISFNKKGDGGFGYDLFFISEGYKKSFAEVNFSEKNKISHRALAVNKLVKYLNDRLKDSK